MSNFTFNTTRSIINEWGAASRMAEICASVRISRPLVVTDQGIVQAGLLDAVLSPLQTGGVEPVVFSDVVADPPEHVVLDALALAQAENVDGVIGFGGGSSMDTAKLIALMARSGETLQQIYGVEQASGQRLPLILIPTTAGTGSEVTAVAIVTTGETTKSGVVAPQLLPDVALLDAELTLGLPAHITAATGIDAMVHAIEAYTSAHKKNAYSDMLARQALQLLAGSIVTATHNGSDRSARENMLLGACLAGQAFANAPVAAVHALAYPLGGHYHIPHGLSNSLVLPAVLRFNASHAGPLYAELAALLVEPAELIGDAGSDTAALITYIERLIREVGLPTTLREVKVPESDLPMLAADAMLQQRLLINNPREVLEPDALAIYQSAF